jgi:secreted PhoX family phosphatase
MNNYLYLLIILLFISLRSHAQIPFNPIPVDYSGNNLLLPSGLKYDVIYREGDTVVNLQGNKTRAKDNNDFNAYIPINGSSEHGYLYVGHESTDTNSVIGDGGGGTVMEVKKYGDTWKRIGYGKAIDFSSIGGTYNNCSGFLTSKGTILSAEEFPPASNALLYTNEFGRRGFMDTSDYNGLKRYQNMGWMVEVDPVSKKALRKLYKMGRYSHEAALVMEDNKTVFLTDDFNPSVFFKFIAEKPNDFTEGQLYAFKQQTDGMSGSWLKLPMAMDSLVQIRDVAMRMGATMFIRMEWLTKVNGKIYVSETGLDAFNWDKQIAKGGIPAKHLIDNYRKTGNNFENPYGCVMEFDPATNKMRPYLSGGKGIIDPTKHFSNTDGISNCKINGKDFLVINEDIIGITKGRVDSIAFKAMRWVNEVWWLDLSIKNPTIDDLQRFMISVAGSETTGGFFTPDYKTYFVNVQHPDPKNAEPFNKSTTIAITGFKPNLPEKKRK